jgi:hypothetical protein
MRIIVIIFAFSISLFGLPVKPLLAQENKASTTPTISKSAIKELVETLNQRLLNNYVYPEKGQLMSKHIKNRYKKGAYNHITDPVQFANQLEKDLQQIHPDGHLHIAFEPGMAKELEKPPLSEEERKQQQRERELPWLLDINFAFQKLEILPGNIGYVRIDGFAPLFPEAKPILNGAFQFLKNTKAIIVDLRYNGGGDPTMVNQVESYFFGKKTHLLNIIDRGNNKTHELYADPAKVDSVTLTMPMYILTSSKTFSGAEAFSYDMQSVKRATIVGETTGGGANLGNSYSLGHGMVGHIPGARPYNLYTKTNWEGIGVKPDISVLSEQALAKAQTVFFADLIAKAPNEKEKNRLKWELNKSIASNNINSPNPATLNQYAGVYQGGLEFYVKDGRLFCKNAERGDEIFELKPVADGLFILAPDVQVQFEKDRKGAYSKIKMLWSDGGISEKSKI